MRRNHGFSLVELMMVIVVFGIVVAAALPNVGHYLQKDYVRKSAEEFKLVCQKTQQLAQRSRQSHRVVYQPAQQRYFVERWDFTASSWVPAIGDTTDLPGSVFIEGGTDTDPTQHMVTFEPLGTIAVSDCPATIEFTNADSDSTTISVVRTGRMVIRHHH
jgi:prepilin-type N-terminal cleavage/methylation domain-containing protein